MKDLVILRALRGTIARLGLTRPVPNKVYISDEGAWYGGLAGHGPQDRNWPSLMQDMDDALDAWRYNFLVRQIVRLTTAYVVGDGITLKASHPDVQTWLDQFWNHRQNRVGRRLSAWCDELTRSGELFIALFTNPADGMSYLRTIPARSIEHVVTDPDDYERELAYHERLLTSTQARVWPAPAAASPTEPALFHFAINRPVGATRGESDLTPILPWAKRYTDWLKDRVRFNRIRSEMAAAWIKVQDDSQVERKRRQYEANPPTGGNIFVTGPAEELSFPAANINATDASPDGLALRLAVAAGANIPLHYLAEGASAARTTAQEMGEPTRRHYRMRQIDFGHMLADLAETAYTRRNAALGIHRTLDYTITAEMPDVSREDNNALATAARDIVSALAVMASQGWVDDRTAIQTAFKFAGEILTDEQINAILTNAGNYNIPITQTIGSRQ